MHRLARLPLVALFAAGCAAPGTDAPPIASSDYLYLWAGGADSTQPDFLAVMDVRPDGDRYGSLVTTVEVPGRNHGPHHTEHDLAADRLLMANGFASGQTFTFDLNNPAEPRLIAQIGEMAGYSHPHSFVRLANGNVLSTFQMGHDTAGMTPGGLVEMSPSGELVRSSSAFGPGVPRGVRAYSVLPIPALDRAVSTTTDMDDGPHLAREVQVWRLSDLALLHTFELPPGPRGDEADYTAEARLLSDGRTVLVSTFSCGLYLLEGLEGDAPSGRLVSSFPRKDDTYCAIPVVIGNHYLVTVPAYPAVVSLDVSDPTRPREVGRMSLPESDVPHWISIEPNTGRVVLTGYGTLAGRVLLATFDSGTGALVLDERFREEGAAEPGFRLAGRPHGAVFSRP